MVVREEGAKIIGNPVQVKGVQGFGMTSVKLAYTGVGL